MTCACGHDHRSDCDLLAAFDKADAQDRRVERALVYLYYELTHLPSHPHQREALHRVITQTLQHLGEPEAPAEKKCICDHDHCCRPCTCGTTCACRKGHMYNCKHYESGY